MSAGVRGCKQQKHSLQCRGDSPVRSVAWLISRTSECEVTVMIGWLIGAAFSWFWVLFAVKCGCRGRFWMVWLMRERKQRAWISALYVHLHASAFAPNVVWEGGHGEGHEGMTVV